MYDHQLCLYHLRSSPRATGGCLSASITNAQLAPRVCVCHPFSNVGRLFVCSTSTWPAIDPHDERPRLVVVVVAVADLQRRAWQRFLITGGHHRQPPTSGGGVSEAAYWRPRIAQTNIMHPIDLKLRAPQTIGHQQVAIDNSLKRTSDRPSDSLAHYCLADCKEKQPSTSLASSSVKRVVGSRRAAWQFFFALSVGQKPQEVAL